jgi:hypothetical protein
MEQSNKTKSCRLYVILAREAPLALIFRRGPSNCVLTLQWNTRKHEFRMGQWFRGRIYERRCDLSPSGDKLVYFAANWRAPFRSWTAVSRAPFLTALALWPKGDAWGGGGLFESEDVVKLNHRSGEMKQAENMALPPQIAVGELGSHSGHGEDDPIHSMRLQRDGWLLNRSAKMKTPDWDARVAWQFDEPTIWTKSHGDYSIQSILLGIKERNGPWYILEHRISNAEGEVVMDIGRSDWADWSQSGEILFAKDGCIYRVKVGKRGGPTTPRLLINLSELEFEPLPPPQRATTWSGPPPAGRPVSK